MPKLKGSPKPTEDLDTRGKVSEWPTSERKRRKSIHNNKNNNSDLQTDWSVIRLPSAYRSDSESETQVSSTTNRSYLPQPVMDTLEQIRVHLTDYPSASQQEINNLKGQLAALTVRCESAESRAQEMERHRQSMETMLHMINPSIVEDITKGNLETVCSKIRTYRAGHETPAQREEVKSLWDTLVDVMYQG